MPSFTGPANGTPTMVNLTCTLDSQPAGRFIHSGSSTTTMTNASTFDTSVPVFVKTGLHDGPHHLTLNVGADSVLLLDYIVYSQELAVDAVQQDAGKASATDTSAQLPTNSASKPISSPSAALSQCVNPRLYFGSNCSIADHPYLPLANPLYWRTCPFGTGSSLAGIRFAPLSSLALRAYTFPLRLLPSTTHHY